MGQTRDRERGDSLRRETELVFFLFFTFPRERNQRVQSVISLPNSSVLSEQRATNCHGDEFLIMFLRRDVRVHTSDVNTWTEIVGKCRAYMCHDTIRTLPVRSVACGRRNFNLTAQSLRSETFFSMSAVVGKLL